jgi:ABC-type phosphate transport system substrate-binding protein
MRFAQATLLLCISLAVISPQALASDELIAVIVSSVHDKNLKKEDITQIFKRKKLYWNDGSKIQPVNLPSSSSIRRIFSQAFFSLTPEEMQDYWNEMYFHGFSPPFVLSSDAAVLKFVEETPGAIGYIPFCNSNIHVAVILVVNAAGHVMDDATLPNCAK